MFLTSRMNFMIIGHDLEVLWKKMFGSFFGHFWSRLPQNFRQEVSVYTEKLPFTLFLHGKSEKNGLETIC
jgi:hypothetical protein